MLVGQCSRPIDVLLVIFVVGMYGDVLGIVRPIVQVIIGILAYGTHLEVPVGLAPCELGEEVTVPFSSHIGIGIGQTSHDTPRQSSFGVEVIRVPL